MATILQFPGGEDFAARARPAVGPLGQIIIFPGVRIERRAADGLSRQPRAPVMRKRTQRSRKKKA